MVIIEDIIDWTIFFHPSIATNRSMGSSTILMFQNLIETVYCQVVWLESRVSVSCQPPTICHNTRFSRISTIRHDSRFSSNSTIRRRRFGQNLKTASRYSRDDYCSALHEKTSRTCLNLFRKGQSKQPLDNDPIQRRWPMQELLIVVEFQPNI